MTNEEIARLKALASSVNPADAYTADVDRSHDVAEVLRTFAPEVLRTFAPVLGELERVTADWDAQRSEADRLRRAIRRFVDAVYADSAADEERKRCLSACEEPFNGGASAEEMAPLVLEHLRAQVRLRDAAKDVRDGIEELTALVRMPPTDEVTK